MTIKPLITSLILVAATSTAAVADPVRAADPYYSDDRFGDRYDRDRYGDRDRFDRDSWRRRGRLSEFSPPRVDWRLNLSRYVGPIGAVYSRSGFVPITAPTRIELARQIFHLSSAGGIDSLKLQGIRGGTRINQLRVVYENGEQEVIPVNEVIGPRNPMTHEIDLRGRHRRIATLDVYGMSGRGSAYRILATSRSRGEEVFPGAY